MYDEPRSAVAAVAAVVEVVGQRVGASYLGRAEAVEAGVDDHPVQPGGDGGVAAEAVRPAVGGHEAVLEPVGRVVGVAHGAQGDRPQPVAVSGEERGEGVVVAGDVGGQEVDVGPVVRRTLSHP